MDLKRLTAILAAAALFAALAGCKGSGGEEQSASPTGSAQTASPSVPAETPSATGTAADGGPIVDCAAAVAAGLEPDTVVFYVESSGVTWREYAYWLQASMGNYAYDHGEITDWNAGAAAGSDAVGTMKVKEYILYDAREMARLYHGIELMAGEMGVSLTDGDEAEISSARDRDVETAGGEEAYLAQLGAKGLTEELMHYIDSVNCLYNKCFVEQYGAGGGKCPDDDVLAYAGLQGVMRAKQIFLGFADGETDGGKAELKARMEGWLGELRASGNPAELFEEMVSLFSEDPEKGSYPNGFTFRPGEMPRALEKAAGSLGENGISGVVESDDGYRLVLRLPLVIDGMFTDGKTVREQLQYDASEYYYNQITDVYIGGLKLVYEDVYASVDLETFCG